VTAPKKKEQLMHRMKIATAALALVLAASTARAATTGAIEGTVLDQASGKKLAGVTVTVTSPALQMEQTEFTDEGGHYIITELPPGEYLVRFYFSNITVERPGVIVQADKTLAANVTIPTQQAKVMTYRVHEDAVIVDVANAQSQTQVTSEIVKNTPVRGRTYDAVMTMAPGATAATGETGIGKGAAVSFNGATGPENNFLIDGVNSTNPAFGLVGTQVTLEFVGETELITGGYNAEYGRATGGVVNVITKSGSNQFHGDVWFYATPFQLQPTLVARSGEAIGSRTREKFGFDFGFDLGGPIVKDKVWFYVGFAPTFNTFETTRILRTRLANDVPAGFTGAYKGDLDPSVTCPAWLDKRYCTTPGFATQELGSEFSRTYQTDNRLYNWIGKLNFQLNPNNSLILQYIGSPQTTAGVFGILNGSEGQLLGSSFDNTHDALIHYVSKLADRRLQLDFVAGYHYESLTTTPTSAGEAPAVLYAVTDPLATFEPGVTPCAPRTVAGGATFNPCPVLNYVDGGFGAIADTIAQRVTASAAATYFARLGGTHALKLGIDFEDNMLESHRRYTGGLVYRVRAGGPEIYREYGTKVQANGPNGDGMPLPGGFSASTSTQNYSAYLRDSYNVGFIPGLTLNAGLRWEAQQVRDVNNDIAIGIYDNLAPRVGAIWDFTRKGRGKLFASYGRFYESIPLDINDRQFSGEGIIAGVGVNCMADPAGRFDTKTCSNPTIRNSQVGGGSLGVVAPSLKGMFSEEVTAGIQWDVGLDMVLGASYIHRNLGRIIEDMSPDGGNNYIIANPGDGVDANAVRDLEKKIASLPPDPASCNGNPGPGCPRATAQQTLGLYKNSTSGFIPPKRTYDALVLTAQKRLSHNFLVLASYTYSRTLGNYPGLFQASNGQLDPNISTQYDLRELLVNRDGPLPNDRPHNIKVQGSYFIPVGRSTFVVGAAFNGFSGAPIEVLGAHASYGRRETYVLPRGSGGRTPFFTQLDLHASYRRQLSQLFSLEAYWDIFNVINQQAVTAVDNEYTTSAVRPIANGTAADLVNLKTLAGGPPILNPNYGRPTAYQAPLSMRFGLRLSF
jgi:carboxypeptidase family protein/TonB-dependent receptor-like protein